MKSRFLLVVASLNLAFGATVGSGTTHANVSPLRMDGIFHDEARFGHIDPSSFKNIVIIPDIHGDLDSLIKALWIAFRDVETAISLEEFQQHMDAFYKGGPKPARLSSKPDETIVVQLGDIVDRGPFGLESLNIIDTLEESIGWRTVRLYGNHEILSNQGKSDAYIHPDERTTFDQYFQTANARVTEFASGGSLWKRITEKFLIAARVAPSSDPDDVSNELTHDGVLPLSSASTLFVHGGMDSHWIDQVEPLLPSDPKELIKRLNELTLTAFTDPDSEECAVTVDKFEQRTSPVWTRDLAQLDQDYVCRRLLPRVLKQFKVARVILGHTPQFDRQMKSLCHSRLILADAAMSRWMFIPPESVQGNPTVLMMKQRNGQLHQMHALYLDTVTGVISKQPFFRTDLGGIEFKPTYSHRGLTDLQTLSSKGGECIHPVTFSMKGMAQQMKGRLMFEKVNRIRTVKPIYSFGLPLVLYQGPMDAISLDFLVIYDAQGVSLREYGDVNVSIRRQIYEVVLDIWTAGYMLHYTMSTTDPKELLDMFILDSTSGLVKFVDYARLQTRRDGQEYQLGQMIGNVAADLSQLKSGDMREYFSNLFFIEEVFGDSVVDVSAYISSGMQRKFPTVQQKQIPSSLPPIVTNFKSTQDEEDNIEGHRFLDFEEPVLDDSLLPGLPTAWAVVSLELIQQSATGSLYSATFDRSSVTKLTKGIILDVTCEQTDREAFTALIAMTQNAEGESPGVPRLASIHHKDPRGGFFVVWDIDPSDLIPLGSDSSLMNHGKIVEEILQIVEHAHSLRVSFALEEAQEDLQQMFFVSVSTNHVWLLDFSGLIMESLASPGFFDGEIMNIAHALGAIFPTVSIVDNSPTDKKSSSSNPRRRRGRASSFHSTELKSPSPRRAQPRMVFSTIDPDNDTN